MQRRWLWTLLILPLVAGLALGRNYASARRRRRAYVRLSSQRAVSALRQHPAPAWPGG